MLKRLYDLAEGSSETGSSSRAEQSGSDKTNPAADRSAVSPDDLEKELKLQLRQALIHIDNCVDITRMLALLETDRLRQFQRLPADEEYTMGRKPLIIHPEILFNKKLRTLAIYWRKNLGVKNRSERIPIRRKSSKSEASATKYSPTLFKQLGSEVQAEAFQESENNFALIRSMIKGLVTARTSLYRTEENAEKFVDTRENHDESQRIGSAKLGSDNWPYEDPQPQELLGTVKLKAANNSKKSAEEDDE